MARINNKSQTNASLLDSSQLILALGHLESEGKSYRETCPFIPAGSWRLLISRGFNRLYTLEGE